MSGHQVDRARGQRRQYDHRLGKTMDQSQEGKREDVEGDVVAEDRIGHAERRAEPPHQPFLPLAGNKETGDRCDENGHTAGDCPELWPARQRELDAFASREYRTQAADSVQRDVQIRDQPYRSHDEREAEQRPLAPDHREKDLAVPHFSEPQPVCVVTKKRRPPEEHEETERQKNQTKRRFHWYLLPAASRSA